MEQKNKEGEKNPVYLAIRLRAFQPAHSKTIDTIGNFSILYCNLKIFNSVFLNPNKD